MHKLVLIRHGESQWNKENRFTGWVDVELSEKGEKEAIAAGKLIQDSGLEFDRAYSSLLKRAINTLNTILKETDQQWIPVDKTWKLNERHYGALQGLNKAETTQKYGEEQVFEWRRSYATPPRELSKEEESHPENDRRYKGISGLPSCEALKQTKERVLPFWESEILPKVLAGEKIIIAAHGNSLRALVMHLDQISEEEIMKLNIPTGIPLVYDLDENGKALKSEYLGDAEAAQKAAESVANQAKQ